MVDTTCSNRYQGGAHVDKVKFNSIQLGRDNTAELSDLHRFGSDAENMEFIDSHLADNKSFYRKAEHAKGGERGPNPMRRESNAANEWEECTLLPGGSIPLGDLHYILSLGKNPW
jgi:hypothetical protein